MKQLCSTIKSVAFLGMAAATAAMSVSCGGLTQWAELPSGGKRPVGWTDETHGKSAPPDYDEVFAQGKVNRLDITIAPADWQAMQDDMTDMLGEFGAVGDGPPRPPGNPGDRRPAGQIPPETVPPEAFEACEGMQEGDACTVSVGGDVISGICTMLSDGRLACIPEGAAGPPPGDGPPPGGGGWPSDAGLIGLLPRNPIYVPCTVEFEGKTWWHVGIRFKGNSTLSHPWQLGITKLPFRFDFDEFEDEYPEIDNQRFFGFKRLVLANNFNDSSMLREKVAHDIFREAGVPAPRTAFYRVYVDFGEGVTYFGLYTMTEVPDGPMFDTQFGEDGGNLYKPEGGGATWVSFDEESFPKKTNKSEEDWSDVEGAVTALHADRSDPAAWRAGLETTLNVDEFLRWLAVNTLVQNWDSYGNMPQNYYLYSNPADAWRLYWIPWDCNEAFKSTALGQPFAPLSLKLDEVDENWPLIRYLMDDPVYWATYVSHVQDVIEGAFAGEPTQERFRAAHDLIAPYVVGADGEQPGYTFLFDSREFDTELDNLLNHVAQRSEAAISFLEANRD
ncbi:MAG: CotH kinase family protein [Phycisphaerae bacterium]|nr:CotH kinase family protein [Phycisphaerae bacterium]